MAKKIGILGTGDAGLALATGFVASGYDVKVGARDAKNEKAARWAQACNAGHGTFADAAKHGEIVVLSTLWAGTENALRLAGLANFKNKVVIDTTNPFVPQPNDAPTLALRGTNSGGETVQRWLPDAFVCKALNTIGHAHMYRPHFKAGKAHMFFCGNQRRSKQTVADILDDFGWLPIDIGEIERSRLLEPLAQLWVLRGIQTGSWAHVFRVLQ